ncbi:EpsG family protein [Aquimarina brevivitae]|nr:EpsG family protein [Aquimarina brevivitae]
MRTNHNFGSIEESSLLWKWPLFLGFLILVLVVGFRYNVGVDYIGYYNDYYNIGYAHHWEAKMARYEFGFEFIIRTLRYFNFRVWALFTLTAIIIWYFFIQSFKVFPFLLKWGFFFAFTTGFFFASMNGMRQTMALVIYMYAIKYIEEKSILRYTLLCVLALSFHTSIILLYPFYFFINKVSFTHYRYLIFYVLSFALGNNLDIKEIVVFGVGLFPKYEHYTDRFLEDFQNPVSGGLGNIYIFIVGFIIILFSRDILKKIPRMKIHYNLFFIGSILFNFFWRYDILGRITYLFIWFKIFCLAALAFYFGKSKSSWLIYLLIVTQFIMFIYKIYKGENLSSPFQF